MSEINIRDARSRFKAMIDRAAGGEEVVLLRHGRPVARLVPPAAGPDRLPPLGRFRASLRPARPAVDAAAALAALRAARPAE